MQSSGDLDNGPELIYQWQEEVEDLEDYQIGGYHPTHIGDRYLDGRYEIVHKLGYGTYSTVWLAKDMLESKHVALKIAVANASGKSKESRILRALRPSKENHRGQAYVPTLLNEFAIDGPNGQHRCIVSEAASCSVAQSKDASITWKFPVDVARAIGAQTLLGLEYIHSCGIVHGDLHSNNILFKSPLFDWCTTEELYRRLGEPTRLPVERLDKSPTGSEAPKYCVQPAMIFQSCEEVTDPCIIISDFGEAFFELGEHSDLRTPILLLPPESLLNESLSKAVDVWTLGHTLYEILGERPLFEGFMPDEHHTIAEMISTIGEFPEKWWDRWQGKEEFFNADRTWKNPPTRAHAPYSRPMAQRLRVMGRGNDPAACEFSKEEMDYLEKLLRSMLTYDPSTRVTAAKAIDSEWMQGWGLPALKKLCPNGKT
ncbi:MAG: hypothetical protein Q9160_002304 [Pyrenula sp. 1 TL-2023]